MGDESTPRGPAELSRQGASSGPKRVHIGARYPVVSTGPHQQEQTNGAQQAPTSQLDMAQQQRITLSDLSAMESAMPQPPCRAQSYGQGAQRFNPVAMLPQGATSQSPGAHFGPPNAMGSLPTHPYYLLPHTHVAHFYQPPLSPQLASSLPSRPDFSYYPSPFTMNQEPHPGLHFYHVPATAFQGQSQHVPAHTALGRYRPPPLTQRPSPRSRQPPSSGPEASSASAVQQANGRHRHPTLADDCTADCFTALPLGTCKTVVRGPPRKPRQSGHAIWIGNLPPQTDLLSLVHHVCKETEGLESLFLISRSNCAFANYKDEQSCSAAQRKLHDSRFMAVRLVSRLRKSTVEGPAGVTAPTGPAASVPQAGGAPQGLPSVSGDAGSNANGESAPAPVPAAADSEVKEANPQPNGGPLRKDRFFILKSLTVEDLELSVRTNIWATQLHNEETLNSAFETSDNVYLIFSANKSGEYFGYARMVSPINEGPAAAIEPTPSSLSTSEVDLPKAIPTEPTEFAPKGRIIDDSARGTIFWEAERDDRGSDGGQDYEGSAGSVGGDTGSVRSGQAGGSEAEPKAWGKPFRLEWLSTTRLPFYRTRGLKNPWNSNREVKIARDGTELEPSVGKRLIGLFNRAQSPAVGMLPSMVTIAAPVGGVRAPAPFATGYPPMQ